MRIQIISPSFERNQEEELIQRAAWRLVRSAEDRYGAGKGVDQRVWAVEQLGLEFHGIQSRAEDYIRAAYINFKTERDALK